MIKLNETYLKKQHSNPFNWTGSKHRYLEDLFSVLPDVENIKVLDPFVGGGDLISKLPKSWSITCSDSMGQVIDLHRAIQQGAITVESTLKSYNDRDMSKTNRETYYALRSEYNETKSIELLYLLMTNSFNNQLRFNKSGGFNMPFGKNRSTFNSSMQSKLQNYYDSMQGRDIDFLNSDYDSFDFGDYDLVLIDPPYTNTVATYNESTGWSKEDDLKLFINIDSAADHGAKFVYFNQTWSKGVENAELSKWSRSYNVRILKTTTESCSYNRGKGATTEVMIWN